MPLKPTYSFDSEKAIIGAILDEGNNFKKVKKEELKSHHFFVESHKILFEIFIRLDDLNIPIDLITVMAEVRKDPTCQIRAYHLVELSEDAPITLHIEHYARHLKDLHARRAIVDKLRKSAKDFTSLTNKLDVIGSATMVEIPEVIKGLATKPITTKGKQLLEDLCDHVRELMQKEGISGVSSGFTEIDALTDGWQPGHLIVLGARPGMGKTALILNFALRAMNQKKRTLIFSLEMSKEQLASRLASILTATDSIQMKKGTLSKQQFKLLKDTVESKGETLDFIEIDDNPSYTTYEIEAKAQFSKADLIVIDYINLINSNETNINVTRERELANISKQVKAMARNLNVPIIAISQLNRMADARPDKRPRLSDLRDSGAIEQDADLVMILYRDDQYYKDSDKKGIAEVLIVKNRHGQQGEVHLKFNAKTLTFRE